MIEQTRGFEVIGTGSYLPERVMTNAELERMVDTSDAWIRARTGIGERRIAAPDEATSDLALVAAERALQAAGILPDAVDLIIVATATPDMPFPPTACLVQHRIGASAAVAFDLQRVAQRRQRVGRELDVHYGTNDFRYRTLSGHCIPH